MYGIHLSREVCEEHHVLVVWTVHLGSEECSAQSEYAKSYWYVRAMRHGNKHKLAH